MLCPRCKVEMRLADPPRCREGGVTLLRLCCRNRQCAEYGTVRQLPDPNSRETNTRADAPANTGAEAPANTTDKEETP